MRQFKTLALRSSATLALLGALSLTAQAQVTIDEDTSEQILTSISGDVSIGAVATEATDDTEATVGSAPTVTIDSERSGVILDSNNSVNLVGAISSVNIDNVTGVEIVGDNTGSYTQSGSIQLLEDFTPEDTNGDGLTEGTFAQGSGRTGILISGASPFVGNVELEAGSTIAVEGNDSFGVNLTNTPFMTDGFTGDLTTSGAIGIVGDNSIGVNVASDVIGNVTNEGSITATGTGAQALAVSGDIDGGFVSNGALSANGFRVTNRLAFSGDDNTTGRENLTAADLQNAGSALSITGDVDEGILLGQVFVESLDTDGNVATDDDGEVITTLARQSTITQIGSAPAVLIAGVPGPDGSIMIGPISSDEDTQFSFNNQGTVTASGTFDDFDATAFSASNVEFEGAGISNEGSLTATTFLGATDVDSSITDGDGRARTVVLGAGASASEFNNSGLITATSNEASDEVFFDRDNIITPRDLEAVGIDIESGASVSTITNTGIIQAQITGRVGTATGIRDESGTVTELVNNGFILTSANTSDTLGLEDTNFNTTAVDFSNSTNSIQINQSAVVEVGVLPVIQGDILLGSGDDTINAAAGRIEGDIDFGGGNDTLSLSGGSEFLGGITNTDNLSLNVSNGSTAELRSVNDIQVSSATFDGTSTYRPTINGLTGETTTLNSNGNITFESGASISPLLESIIGSDQTSFTLATADNLTIGDLEALNSGATPFLFNQSLSLNPSSSLGEPDTLVITLDLRDPNASVADGGLGLDSVQAAAFGTVVDGEAQSGAVLQALASASSLGNAFANITEANEFNSALNQILPEFSGAARQFVLANVDGAVGAVGSHLDTARRSPDKSGGAWLQEYFYFADRELAGNSEQYRGDGFGFAAGLDTSFGPFHAVGVSAGFSSTEVEDVLGTDDPLDIRTYQLGGYAALEKNGFDFDVYAGGGISEFEQDRRVNVGTFSGAASSEWEGAHANASLRAGYDFDLGEKFWVRPSLSLDYLYLNEYGRTETGTEGFRLRVDGRNSETASASALLNFGAKFQGKRTWIRPSIRVGYRNEFISDPLETAFRFQGLTDAEGNVFDSELATLRSFAFPDEGILLGFTVAAGSEYSSIGFDVDSDIRDGFIRHTGRIVIRLLF